MLHYCVSLPSGGQDILLPRLLHNPAPISLLEVTRGQTIKTSRVPLQVFGSHKIFGDIWCVNDVDFPAKNEFDFGVVLKIPISCRSGHDVPYTLNLKYLDNIIYTGHGRLDHLLDFQIQEKWRQLLFYRFHLLWSNTLTNILSRVDCHTLKYNITMNHR